MKKHSFRIVCILLLLALVLPMIPVSAKYANGYDGTMAGQGNGILAKGVDLSEWQGSQVDFSKIAAAGYSFVILRAGFAQTKDVTFEENYQKAKKAGLDVGVYLYSYAENEEEARQEAAAARAWLQGKTLEYPVYFDLEDPETHGSLSKDTLTKIAFAFLDNVSKEGWLVGLYSCKSWLDEKIDTKKIGEKYECWMAQYLASGSSDTYKDYDSVYGMWQYTASGTVDGVVGNVDLNVCFKDYPAICRSYGFNGYSATDASIVLTGLNIPTVLKPGDTVSIDGVVTSTAGNLTNVTVGFFNEADEQIAGRSIGPKAERLELSTISGDIKVKQLPEGAYWFRVAATNREGTELLMSQSVVVSKSGLRADNLALPEQMKQGDGFKISGTLTAVAPLTNIVVSVKSGDKTILTESVASEENHYDLSELAQALDFKSLSPGSYTYQISASVNSEKMQTLASSDFRVWVKSDPITVSELSLKEDYSPDDQILLSGTISSEKSEMQKLTVELMNHSQQVLFSAELAQAAKTASLQELCKDMDLDSLVPGSYTLVIKGLNSGGPCTVMEKRFCLHPDSVDLCGCNAPRYLKPGETFSLSGVVTSDRSPLELVTVSVTDVNGRELLSSGGVPSEKSFDLERLNDQLLFCDLPENIYTLRICGRNARGYHVLYEKPLTVTNGVTGIYWKEQMPDPSGMTVYPGCVPSFTGTLTSSASEIKEVAVRVLGGEDVEKCYISAFLYPNKQTVGLSEIARKLRFSALPEGQYHLVITAKDEVEERIMLDAPISVSSCAHRHVTSGIAISPTCTQAGALVHSQCLDCGMTLRSGQPLERTKHNYRNGICTGCGRHEPITVSAIPAQQLPQHGCRIVIAAKDGQKWYALGSDGRAVEIPAPVSGEERLQVSSELLWEPVARRDGTTALRNPFGELLHLGAQGPSVAHGVTNTRLVLDISGQNISILTKADVRLFLSLQDRSFILSTGAAEVRIFLYEP